MSNLLIDIALGFGLIPVLILANVIVLGLVNTFKEAVLGVAGVMMGLDTIACLGWGFMFRPYVTDSRIFICGIGVAIFCALAHKVLQLQKLNQ